MQDMRGKAEQRIPAEGRNSPTRNALRQAGLSSCGKEEALLQTAKSHKRALVGLVSKDAVASCLIPDLGKKQASGRGDQSDPEDTP